VECSAHNDNRQRNVAIVVKPRDPEPRHVADGNLSHVLYLNWNTVRLAQYDILDVVDAPALGQIFIAAAIE